MHYDTKSDSYKNILSAISREAEGHLKYTVLSEDAMEDGNADLARLYAELAGEELCHAKLWYREAHPVNGRAELDDAIKDETDEAASGYPEMAARAELEGYEALSDRFLANGRAEAAHRDRLMKYRREAGDGTRYRSHEETLWRCTVCGHSHVDLAPPEACPLCGYGHTAYKRAD